MEEAMIGVDPHKATHNVAAVDGRGVLLEHATFPASRAGLRSLVRWSKRFPEHRWAVEGASGVGHLLAQHLAASGEKVVDVPAKLSARVRALSVGNGRKNDRLDALYVALAALHAGQLREVDEEGHAAALGMLSERREDLVRERTRALNRLHRLLAELLPGGVPAKLSAEGAAKALRGVRARSVPGKIRRQLAAELVRDVRRLDRLVSDLDHRIREAVAESGTNLTEIFGVGPLLAAKIVGRVGSVARFPTRAHFASYTGTAPIEASSGGLVRHRLSRAGDRQLNAALHVIAICQVRHGTEGGDYYLRKLAEGKSRREALRCLKRRLSDVVFRKLSEDLDAAVPATA